MKTYLLMALVFTVLAVTLAGPKPKRNSVDGTRDVEKSTLKDTEKKDSTPSTDNESSESESESDPEVEKSPTKSKAAAKGKAKKTKPIDSGSRDSADESSPSKSKKRSKPASNKKSSKIPVQRDEDEDEDLVEILRNEEDEEVEIPRLDQLTTTTDPIELGEKIKNIADEEKRNDLISELRELWNENRKSLPGKFYGAALVAVKNANKASKFWEKQLENATKKVKKTGKSVIDNTRQGLGSAMEKTRKIIEADPIGLQLQRGESVLLTALSDTIKNMGKLSDSVYDAALNTSGIVRTLTGPVDLLPIAGTVKNNFHNTIEDGLKRGRYVNGSFADNGSEALSNAAKDADSKANEKEDFLKRQFSPRRTLV